MEKTAPDYPTQLSPYHLIIFDEFPVGNWMRLICPASGRHNRLPFLIAIHFALLSSSPCDMIYE